MKKQEMVKDIKVQIRITHKKYKCLCEMLKTLHWDCDAYKEECEKQRDIELAKLGMLEMMLVRFEPKKVKKLKVQAKEMWRIIWS